MSRTRGERRRTLSEHDSTALLRRFGVPFVARKQVATPDDAAAAAGDLGFPVVVKLAGEGIAHKTERGIVRLELPDKAAVTSAAADLLAAARPEDGAVSLLVAPMVRGSREIIAGVHFDDQFGPCVMVGLGGVLTEALGDVAFRLVPIDDVDAHEMIDDLAGARVLGPVRGEPAVDRDALAAVLLALSRCAETTPEVRAIDVNPLIIVDGRPVAVDALVEVAVA